MHFPQRLSALLESGGWVVTANARAALDLRLLHGRLRAQEGARAWANPAIFDWQGWLGEQWQKLMLTGTEDRLLLTAIQEDSVWAEIVRPVVASGSLIAPREIARLAQDAYARLVAYDGRSRFSGSAWDVPGSETELFRQWAWEFERRCERQGWMSASQLPWVVADGFARGLLQAPGKVAWMGFDRVTPAESAVRAAMAGVGCSVEDAGWEFEARVARLAAATLDTEMDACAEWTKAVLAQRPEARVAVLLPDAEKVRAQMDRVFRRVLMPESNGLRSVEATPRYEFTLGLALGDLPAVKAATIFLRGLAGAIQRNEISWLVNTGFFGDLRDCPTLADADARLQREELLPPEQSLDALLARMERRHLAPAWTARIRSAQAILRPWMSRERGYRQWSELVEALLEQAGWPGERVEDSMNYQARSRWGNSLESLTGLDFSGRRVPFSSFLETLDVHLKAEIFAPQSESAPVTISGVPESAGRAFDAVWMLQATDAAWPARSSPHPLLPLWLQKELGMPHGDAREDAEFSAKVMGRLRASAGEVVFSHALEGEDGPQRPSPSIRDFSRFEAPAITRHASVQNEDFEDHSEVAWTGGTRPAGGQEVLKMQAACPFQAFAVKRLGAKQQRSSERGLDAAQRGTLLHEILHALWADKRLGGSAGLNGLGRVELSECIREHVDWKLAPYLAYAGAWEKEYLKLERQRLCELVDEWLAYESTRRPFAVEMVEKEKPVEVNGLHLNVRLDRVDRLLDGDAEVSRVLIDYKTGRVHSRSWKTPRMDEPQLPLYAVAGGLDGLCNVLFAQVRPEEKKFVDAMQGHDGFLYARDGRSKGGDDAPTFAARLEEWTHDLELLSGEFRVGKARVDPKHKAGTCEYCALPGLCRVAEAGVGMADEDEES